MANEIADTGSSDFFPATDAPTDAPSDAPTDAPTDAPGDVPVADTSTGDVPADVTSVEVGKHGVTNGEPDDVSVPPVDVAQLVKEIHAMVSEGSHVVSVVRPLVEGLSKEFQEKGPGGLIAALMASFR